VSKSRTAAAYIVVTAVRAHTEPEILRGQLLQEKVSKGTVSKIITVLHAYNEGILDLTDIYSLSEAYNLVLANRRADKLIGHYGNTPSYAQLHKMLVMAGVGRVPKS